MFFLISRDGREKVEREQEKKRKKERKEERKEERNIYTNIVNGLTIVDLIILEDTSNPSTRSTMVKKLCTLCSRWFSNKSNLNRHVKNLHQDHYTKTGSANSTCTEGGSCKRCWVGCSKQRWVWPAF